MDKIFSVRGFTPQKKSAGFTLIELLIVAAIIGIIASISLVSLSSGRASARDDRRIANLLQTQQALQAFYLKCGFYPGQYNSEEEACEGGELSNPTLNPINWRRLQVAFGNANIGFGVISNDPIPSLNYEYYVQLGNLNETQRAQCYVLRAKLETGHKALQSDLDNQDLISKLAPASCTGVNCKNLYPDTPVLDCDDGAGTLNYCVGNLSCFYGL